MIENKYKKIIESSIIESGEVRKLSGWSEAKKGKYLALSTAKYLDYDLKIIKIEGVIPANYEKVASYFF